MLELSIVLIHALHLLCMNVASAGPLVCVWLDWRQGKSGPAAGQAARFLAAAALGGLLLGAALGTALGALLWDANYAAVLGRLGGKIHAGVWELLFSGVLLGVYLAWWKYRSRVAMVARITRSAVAVLLTTNLLYHFPVLFGAISQLDNQRAVEGGPIDSAAFREYLVDMYVVSRSIHFVLASIAVSGVALVGYSAWKAGRPESAPPESAPPEGAQAEGVQAESAQPESASRSGLESRQEEENSAKANDWSRLARAGGWIGLVPTVAQIPVGLWVLIALPDDAKRRLMGQDVVGSLLLVVGLLAALWLMHLLSSVALGHATPGKCRLAVGATVLVVLLMTGLSRRARPPQVSQRRGAPEVRLAQPNRDVASGTAVVQR